MVRTLSTMLEIGTKAPEFSLPDVVTGRMVSAADAGGRPLLVMFLCRHCPYVKHVQQQLAALGAEYELRGVAIVAISSNDAAEHPDDRPESLKEMAQELRFTFPLCYDE